VVEWEQYKSFYIADIPGIIEGASEGRGLGLQFLRHVERTRFLVHLLDPLTLEAGRDPVSDYLTLNSELASYSAALAAKPQIVAVNKTDALGDVELERMLADELRRKAGVEKVHMISAVSGRGLRPLVTQLGAQVEKLRREEAEKLEPGKDPL